MIIENSKEEFVQLPDKNHKIRKGYLGHLNKIANDILRCGNIDDNIQKYLKNSDWLNYVSTVLKKTNDINNIEVGGYNPRNLMNFNLISESQFGLPSSDYKPVVNDGGGQIQEGEFSTINTPNLMTGFDFVSPSIPDILKSKAPPSPLYPEVEQMDHFEDVKINDLIQMSKSPEKKADEVKIEEAGSPKKQTTSILESDPTLNSNFIDHLLIQKNIVETTYSLQTTYSHPIISIKNDSENSENVQSQAVSVLMDSVTNSNLSNFVGEIDTTIKEQGKLFESNDISCCN